MVLHPSNRCQLILVEYNPMVWFDHEVPQNRFSGVLVQPFAQYAAVTDAFVPAVLEFFVVSRGGS